MSALLSSGAARKTLSFLLFQNLRLISTRGCPSRRACWICSDCGSRKVWRKGQNSVSRPEPWIIQNKDYSRLASIGLCPTVSFGLSGSLHLTCSFGRNASSLATVATATKSHLFTINPIWLSLLVPPLHIVSGPLSLYNSPPYKSPCQYTSRPNPVLPLGLFVLVFSRQEHKRYHCALCFC